MKERNQRNVFTGGLNVDDDRFIISEEDYINAFNIRHMVNNEGQKNLVSNVLGNSLIPYAQTGDNVVIGSYENLSTSECVYIVWNSQGNHEIRKYGNGVIVKLADIPQLDQKYIPFIDLVDNKLLYWTDTKPRKLNIDKSYLDKENKGNLYFASQDPSFVPAGTAIDIAVLDKDNNVVGFFGFATFIDTNRQELCNLIALAINLNINQVTYLGQQINVSADACNGFVEVTFSSQYFLVDVSFSSPLVSDIYVPQNYYFDIIDSTYDAGKYPLSCPPDLEIKLDTTRQDFNKIEDTAWQFRTELLFDDNEKSTLSPISDMAFTSCTQRGNYIEIDYTDPRLNNPTDLSIIKAVRIYGRNGNNDKFRLIVEIPQSELWEQSGVLGTNIYKFYNDGIYTVLDDFTALKQYDDLPIKPVDDKYSICQEFADDRIMYARYTKNYDRPCISADLVPKFTEIDDTTYELSIIIRIRQEQQFFLGNPVENPNNYKRGNIGAIYLDEGQDYPYFGGACNRNVITGNIGIRGQQILPEKGFIGYLAGTDYMGISRQNNNSPNGNINFTSDGIIDGTTQSNRDLLRDWYVEYNNTSGGIGDMFSTLTIKGVKKGKYALRLASHWCSFGDKLSKGNFYDLNNGRLYQQTSTHLRSIRPNINGTYQSEFEGSELIVEIDDSGVCTVSNFSGVIGSFSNPSNQFFLGDFYVEDLSMPSIRIPFSPTPASSSLTYFLSSSGYCVDGNGFSDINEIRRAPRTELAILTTEIITISEGFLLTFDTRPFINLVTSAIYSLPTDHNGYFYFKAFTFGAQTAPVYLRNIQYNNVQGRLNSSFFYETDSGVENPSILRDIYETELYRKNTFDGNNAILGNGDFAHCQAYIFTTNQNFTNSCRTLVTGKVTDTNGTGIGGIPVLITRNGRFENTQSDGTFSILVYRDGIYGNEDRILDQIILREGDCSLVTYAISQTNYASFPLTIQTIDEFGTYNNLIPYAPSFLNNVILTTVFSLARKLKSGGNYSWSIIHVDDLNRRHSLVPIGQTYIPYFTEQRQSYYQGIGIGQSNGVFGFDLRLNSTPPDWAVKAYLLRTYDEIYQSFIQFPLDNVLYVSYYDEENALPIQTTYSTFSANEIYLGFKKSITNYTQVQSGNIRNWTYEKGDRVRFIRRVSGQLYPQLFDFPIQAERVFDGQTYYVIEALDALGEVLAGDLVEAYRPRKRLDDEQKLYFEIHTCIDVIEVNGVKQYAQTTIPISTGDTYTRTRIVPISSGATSNFIEDPSLSDFVELITQDIGRANIEDAFFEEIKFYTQICFSGKYFPNTKVNNLNRFDALNTAEMPRNYGEIFSIKLTDDNRETPVLLSIHENKVLSIYIGAVQFKDTSGSDLVSLSNEVLGSYRTLTGTYGTRNAESVFSKNGLVYFADANRRKWVKYTNNGLSVDSDKKMKTHFDQINSPFYIVGHDDFYEQTIVTYQQGEGKQTLAWNEEANRWESFYNFTPEYYGSANEQFLSFLNGELWLHNVNQTRNNFYGTQYSSSIKTISKTAVMALKTYLCMREVANQKWKAFITTQPDASYPTGMSTQWYNEGARVREGDWWADILRDINDPKYFGNPQQALFKGRKIKGHFVVVELTNESEALAWLRAIDVYFQISENTTQ